MLHVTIPAIKTELFDESTDEFIVVNLKAQDLQLEHSLVSLSKWEAEYKKPFIGREDKSLKETLDYIRCMTLTQNVSPEVYQYIPKGILEEIGTYMDAPMTATTFNNRDKSRNQGEVITSEIIYYWMVSLNIPFECQKWHLNRLLALIQVCNAKNAPPKKMGQQEIAERNKALNAARRKKLQTKG